MTSSIVFKNILLALSITIPHFPPILGRSKRIKKWMCLILEKVSRNDVPQETGLESENCPVRSRSIVAKKREKARKSQQLGHSIKCEKMRKIPGKMFLWFFIKGCP
jgi:hypothetical protein